MTDAAASSPEPDAPAGVSRQTIVIVTSVGGGLLAASFFLAASLPAGGPFMASVFMGFVGAVALFVGSLLGALSRHYSTGARALYGVGAGLAFLLVVTIVFVGPALATGTAPVCGAIAAGPGLLALRSFTMLRDAGV